MKFSPRTLQFLKSFTGINPSIYFRKGNKLSTISPANTILATALIDETIPEDFAIYDVSRFLNVLSLFEAPELTFDGGDYVTIKSESQKVKYMFTDPSMIVTPPPKAINIPTPEIEFNLNAATLAKLQKALAVLQMPEIAVVGEEGVIKIATYDSRGAISDSFSADIGETDHSFRMILKTDNMKLISGDYLVSISSKKISRFMNDSVTYFIACESNSTFTPND